jgi:hypothetical protein
MNSTSPVGQHDQLPMVDGLESIAPPTELEPEPSAPAELEPAPLGAVERIERSVPAPPRDRDVSSPARDAAPDVHVDEPRGEERRAAPARESDLVRTPTGASPIAPASAIDRAPTPVRPEARRATNAFDLADLLGRISREIADANRDLPHSSALDVPDDVPLPTMPPVVEPPRSPALPAAPTAIPAPVRAREPVALPAEVPSPPQPQAIGRDDAARPPTAPTVTIGELHIEVVHESPPPGRRSHAEPTRAAPKGRGPIAVRPSKRRFAAGRE